MRGILSTDGHNELFFLQLDRSGDEDQIYENTMKSYDAIREAEMIVGTEEISTARFEYVTDNRAAALAGLATYSNTVLYLYGTCEHLGDVTITDDSRHRTVWKPVSVSTTQNESALIKSVSVVMESAGRFICEYRVVRFQNNNVPTAALIIVLQRNGDGWKFNVPPRELSKLFFRFPIRGGDLLPVNCVIDGHFSVSQERDRIHMRDSDKEQIDAALSLLPVAVQWAVSEDCVGAHLLGHVAMPDHLFGALTDADRAWWRTTLARVAGDLSLMPIVRTGRGDIPADGHAHGAHADFIMPRFELDSQDELDLSRVWKLATQTKDVDPPLAELAYDWMHLALGWASLGVKVHMLALTDLAVKARRGVISWQTCPLMSTPVSGCSTILIWLEQSLSAIIGLLRWRIYSQTRTGLCYRQRARCTETTASQKPLKICQSHSVKMLGTNYSIQN